jgi:hypothetical protein
VLSTGIIAMTIINYIGIANNNEEPQIDATLLLQIYAHIWVRRQVRQNNIYGYIIEAVMTGDEMPAK